MKMTLFFSRRADHSDWINLAHKEIKRSKERFIKHFEESYDGFPKVPIWVAIEVMTFGRVSSLYFYLHKSDQVEIAREIGIHSSLLSNWLHVLSYVRNICAHHGRIWNRELAIKPILPKVLDRGGLTNDKTASVLYLVKAFMKVIPTRENEFAEYKAQIKQAVQKVEKMNVDYTLSRMGIIDKNKFLQLFI